MAAPRSDRPLAPRLADELEVVDLASLSSGECEEVELVGALPDGFDEPLRLTGVRLRHASLVGADVAGSRLVDVVVESTDASGVDLDGTSATRVRFTDVRFSGAQLTQTRWRDAHFVDCRLDDVSFAMAAGEHLRFERCRLRNATLCAAELAGVAWWDCDLSSADVTGIKVARAQLHGSTIDAIRGALALAPLAIDADQAHAFAQLMLDDAGIVVVERDEG